MKTKFMPDWLRNVSQVVLVLPMVGFLMQLFGSDYFKQYLANVFISVLESTIQLFFGLA